MYQNRVSDKIFLKLHILCYFGVSNKFGRNRGNNGSDNVSMARYFHDIYNQSSNNH